MINVELKTNVVKYDGSGVTVVNDEEAGCEKLSDTRCIEEKVHEMTVEMDMDMEKRVTYSSLSHDFILKMQQYVTEEQTAFLGEVECLNAVEYGVVNNVHTLYLDMNCQGVEAIIKEARRKGLKVHMWMVNEEEYALGLRNMDVDAILQSIQERCDSVLRSRNGCMEAQ